MIDILWAADASVGWAFGLSSSAIALAAIVYSFLGYRRHHLATQSALAWDLDPPPLAPGRVTLRGIVRTADGEPAVTIRIRQEGEENHGKSGWTHSFTERSRDTIVRPFSLELPDGRGVIWVEPNRQVRLADDLETVEITAWNHRVRAAVLRPGERVSVTGDLTRGVVPGKEGDGYRSDGSGWALRPGPGSLLSTEEPATASRRWTRFHGSWLVVSLLFLLSSQTALFMAFYDVALNGQVCRGRVTDLDTYGTPGPGGSRGDHFVVFARTDDACPWPDLAVSAEVSRDSFDTLELGQGLSILAVGPRPEHAQIGQEPVIHIWAVFVSLCGLTMLAVAYFAHRERLLRWWERRWIVEHGTGRLKR